MALALNKIMDLIICLINYSIFESDELQPVILAALIVAAPEPSADEQNEDAVVEGRQSKLCLEQRR